MEEKKKKPGGTIVEGAEAAGRFVKARPDTVKKLQDYAAQEAERQKKKKAEAEAAKKKQPGVNAAPKGIFERLFGG